MMDSNKATVTSNAVAVYFVVSFRQLCLVTVSLPLCGLLICFITAYIFQQDDIHETHCRMLDLDSFKLSMDFGSGCLCCNVKAIRHDFNNNWCTILSLPSVPLRVSVLKAVHEKIFIVFMICSLAHMLATIKEFTYVKHQFSEHELRSYNFKRFLFATSLISTLGLMIFFLKHRLLCHDMAFSWFSLCEYIIASANMAFHITVMLDFPDEDLIVGRGLTQKCKHQEIKQD